MVPSRGLAAVLAAAKPAFFVVAASLLLRLHVVCGVSNADHGDPSLWDSPRLEGEVGCWDTSSQFTAEHCCNQHFGPNGDESCWNFAYTFARCCLGSAFEERHRQLLSVAGFSEASSSRVPTGDEDCIAVLHELHDVMADSIIAITRARRFVRIELDDAYNRMEAEFLEAGVRAYGPEHVSSWVQGMEPIFRHNLLAGRAYRQAREAATVWRLVHPRCASNCGRHCVDYLDASLWVDFVEQDMLVSIHIQGFDGSKPFTGEGWAGQEQALFRHIEALEKAHYLLASWLQAVADEWRSDPEAGLTVQSFYACQDGGAFLEVCHFKSALRPAVYGREAMPDHAWTFGGTSWTLDQALLFHAASRVFRRGDRIADVGAGPGLYAEWLNATGQFAAVSFDGTDGVEHMTRGRVRFLDASGSLPRHLRGRFHWVLSLEFIEHVPPLLETAVLTNLAAMCTQGVIVSWSPDWQTNHLNPREFHYIRRAFLDVGLEVDEAATEALRRASRIPYIKRSVAVFRKVSSQW